MGEFFGCALHRTRQIVELDQIAIDVGGRRNDAADILARGVFEHAFPITQERLGGRYDQIVALDTEWHDGKAIRIIDGHQIGQIGEIDLQRIDVEILHADMLCQPFRQRIQYQDTVRR